MIIILCEGVTDFVFLHKILDAKGIETYKGEEIKETLKTLFGFEEKPRNCCKIGVGETYMLSVAGKENFRLCLSQLSKNLEYKTRVDKIIIVADKDFESSGGGKKRVKNFEKEFDIEYLIYECCLERYLLDLIKHTEDYKKVSLCYESLFSKKVEDLKENIEFKKIFSILHAIFSPKNCFPDCVSKICEKYRDELINLKITKDFLGLIAKELL